MYLITDHIVNLYLIYKSISKMVFLLLEQSWTVFKFQEEKIEEELMNPGNFLIVGMELYKNNVFGVYTVNSA